MEINDPLKFDLIEQTDNLATELSEFDLNAIASELCGFYQKDENDCHERHEKMSKFLGIVDNDKEYRRVAKLQNGANNHYSLMTDAVNEFQTTFINEFDFHEIVRAVPTDKAKSQQDIALEIQSQVPNATEEEAQQLVMKNIKRDRAIRYAIVKSAQDAVDLLNYQFTEDMPNWIEETQSMAKLLACHGTVIRKYSFCPIEKIPVFKLIEANKFVVDCNARSINGAKRLSECEMYDHSQIFPLIESEYFRPYQNTEELRQDKDAYFNIVEMCCRLDLDNDGYPEPYVVWFDKERSQILRIEKNFKQVFSKDGKIIVIKAKERYCRYAFLPNPKSFFGYGLCDILEQSQNALSSLTNLMIDAGAKSTLGGGFFAGDINKVGPIRFSPGEYKPLRITGQALREGIVDMPTPTPNQTLFAVMQLLDSKANSLANLNQFNSENFSSNTAPTTAMILHEQSSKKLRAILKRIFMSFEKEVNHLVEANREYLSIERYNFLLGKNINPALFASNKIKFVPNVNYNEIGNIKGMAKVQFQGSMKDDPFVNPKRVRQDMYSEMGYDDPDYFVTDPPPPPQPAPDPIMMASIEAQKKQLEIQAQKVALDNQKLQQDMQQFMQKMQLEYSKLQADFKIRTDKNNVDQLTATHEAIKDTATAINQSAQAEKTGVDTAAVAQQVEDLNRQVN